jgi:thiol-disulfide isomerase/thioredoxin
MKLKLTALGLLLLIFILSSCQEKPNFTTNGEAIIAGKILNFEKHEVDRNFDIVYQGLLELQSNTFVEINDDGTFHTTIPCNYKKDFFIRFNRVSAIYICEPKDSIFITLDADVLDDPKNHYPNGSYFVKVTGGSRIEDIALINEFWQDSHKIVSFSERKTAAKELSPMNYYAFQNQLEKSKIDLLDSIINSSDSEMGIFKDWAKDHLKYNKLSDLIRYAYDHLQNKNLEPDSLRIPNEYYAQILNEDINESEFFSFGHIMFFHNYYNLIYIQAKKESIDVSKYANQNAIGFSKDVILAKYFYSLIKKSDTLVDIDIDIIEDEHLKNLLTNKIDILQQEKLELLESHGTSLFLDSIVNPYKGKVVYIDFWGTWCVPCLKEMPYSKALQEEFKKKPVEFLFLCNQSSKNDWQKMIKEKELPGTHILLSDQEYAKLQDLFGIMGIPHYIIVNKQGGYINNAKRPSDKNIGDELNRLINE